MRLAPFLGKSTLELPAFTGKIAAALLRQLYDQVHLSEYRVGFNS